MSKQSKRFRDEEQSLDLYLREIGETPLITADEEIELAKRIKKGDTKAIDELIIKHADEISEMYQIKEKHIILLTKR